MNDERITATEIENALFQKMQSPECSVEDALKIATMLLDRIEGPREVNINVKGVQTLDEETT